LGNHLDNVLVTVSDRKIGVDSNSDGQIDYYTPEVVTANDYYPFNMEINDRTFAQPNSSYRYSINGQEKSDEIATNLTTAKFWEYDSRIARRWNKDPKQKEWEGPYVCFSDDPIGFTDALGDSDIYKNKYGNVVMVVHNNDKSDRVFHITSGSVGKKTDATTGQEFAVKSSDFAATSDNDDVIPHGGEAPTDAAIKLSPVNQSVNGNHKTTNVAQQPSSGAKGNGTQTQEAEDPNEQTATVIGATAVVGSEVVSRTSKILTKVANDLGVESETGSELMGIAKIGGKVVSKGLNYLGIAAGAANTYIAYTQYKKQKTIGNLLKVYGNAAITLVSIAGAMNPVVGVSLAVISGFGLDNAFYKWAGEKLGDPPHK
jgi:hypothetical protein